MFLKTVPLFAELALYCLKRAKIRKIHTKIKFTQHYDAIFGLVKCKWVGKCRKKCKRTGFVISKISAFLN
jgi:hypothetical protein